MGEDPNFLQDALQDDTHKPGLAASIKFTQSVGEALYWTLLREWCLPAAGRVLGMIRGLNALWDAVSDDEARDLTTPPFIDLSSNSL